MAQGSKGKRLKGKPVIVDKLDAELGGKLVRAVMDDMERAAEQRSGAGSEVDAGGTKRKRVDRTKRR